ncbi:unnamed protein product, partial [Closterium sp. NIES-53]
SREVFAWGAIPSPTLPTPCPPLPPFSVFPLPLFLSHSLPPLYPLSRPHSASLTHSHASSPPAPPTPSHPFPPLPTASHQVEYAMEAISHAGSAIGILATDGVVLAAEKRITSKLLESSKTNEKMYRIDDHVAAAVAGITADANILVNSARLAAQRYTYAYQEPIPMEQLVQSLCDTKQGYF